MTVNFWVFHTVHVEVSEVVVVRDVELQEAFKVVDFERLRPHSETVHFRKVEKHWRFTGFFEKFC